MQIVGAHYTFELVPFGFVSDLIGASRNHYDRIAHFMVGVNSYLVAEYTFKRGVTNGVGASAFFGLIAIMAFANLWELIEWTYAEIDGGEVGAAFLGVSGRRLGRPKGYAYGHSRRHRWRLSVLFYCEKIDAWKIGRFAKKTSEIFPEVF